MRSSAFRLLAVAGLAAATITCADAATGSRSGGYARIALAPQFAVAPAGGPDIDITRVRGVLRSGGDSAVADAPVEGDSAILEFNRVQVRGDSTAYELGVQAFDRNNVLVFESDDTVQVKAGDNESAAPTLDYIAPDATVDAIDIVDGGTLTALSLQWAGARTGNTSCLSRRNPQQDTATISRKLAARGRASANAPFDVDVRVGWTSRDTTVVTVDTGGTVRARCSGKSTWVVARTFTDKADSIEVTVSAQPFTLLMTPDSSSVARGGTQQLNAMVVDENNNQVPASTVSWHTSDETRATVSNTGLVSALRNGRVQITATSGSRSTVAIVNVVRPTAAKTVVIPEKDTLAVNMIRGYLAKAIDAQNRVIGDAAPFQWSSSNTSVATVGATTGLVTATGTGDALVFVEIDGKKDTLLLNVQASLPPGTIKGRIVDANDSPVSGAVVARTGGSATSQPDGTFSLTGVVAGDNLTVSKAGFASVTFFDVPSFSGQTIQVPDVPLAPAGGTGTMTGKVVNALTGAVISGVTVTAYEGLNAAPSPRRPNPAAVATATTNGSGVYTMSSVAAGAYTLVAKFGGYSDAIGVGVPGRTSPDIFLAPVTSGGTLYAIVNWSNCSNCNLDLYLTGPKSPTDATRFTVFSGDRAWLVGNDTIAALDLPNQNSGSGPEVSSIRPAAAPGVYRLYVHDVTNATNGASTALTNNTMSARVDVFQDGRVIGTFFPPSGQPGTLWEVFKYDGARIFPGGQITDAGSPPTVP